MSAAPLFAGTSFSQVCRCAVPAALLLAAGALAVAWLRAPGAWLLSVLSLGLAVSAAGLLWRARCAQDNIAQQRLARLLAASDDGLWEHDFGTGQLVASVRTAQILGLPPEKLSLRAMLRRVPAASRHFLFERIRSLIQDQIVVDELLELHIEGAVRWINWRALATRRPNSARLACVTGSVSDVTVSMEQTVALEQERGFVARVLDSLPVPVAVRDDNDKFVIVNQAYGELVARSKQDLLSGRAPVASDSDIDALDLGIGSAEVLTRWVTVAEGQPKRYLRVTSRSCSGHNGQPMVISSFEDLSQLRQQEEQQFALRGFLQNVFDAIPNSVFVKDEAHRYIITNVAHLRFLGLTDAADVIGKTSFDFTPDIAEAIEAAEVRLFQAGEGALEEMEFVIRDPQGRDRNTLMRKSLTAGPNGQLVTVGVNTDITTLRQTERDLRRILNRFAMLIEGAPLGIALLDIDGAILHANPALCAMTGYALDALQHKQHSDISPPDEAELDHEQITSMLRRGFCGPFEKHYIHQNGERIPVMVTGVVVREDGRNTLVWGLVQDMSASHRAQEEIRLHRDHLRELVAEQTADLLRAKEAAEQASASKSDFLANMSHELRTPMHAILSFARLGQARVEWAGTDKLRDYFSRVVQSGERLMSLLTDLLDLSKMDAGQMSIQARPLDLGKLIHEVGHEYEAWLAAKRLSLRVDIAQELPAVAVDSVRMGQVLRNLLSNAAKFSPEGAAISVSLRHVEQGAPPCYNAHGELLTVECVVSDQGIGIPEKELETVFEKFVQSSATRTGAGGTGLGLTICREIVTAHRGLIFARNCVGAGAEFVMRLPSAHTNPVEESA